MESRTALLFAVVAVLVALMDRTATAAPQKETASTEYTNKFDNIDIDQVLASKRLVNNYVQCLMDKKPCSAEGSELRKVLPDALKTQCIKCSPKQKNAALKVVERLQKDYPTEWKQLLDKWDPKREYSQKFEEFLQEEKKKNSSFKF
ncbi:Insect odorant-binding protein A10/Ejaculatory bulb-specific protein 3 [Cinara cedri]|uniref:Insect odorant-binding protein A10/Ejaculatory bulb-specific protein 3 n=1 Tax=Cinara cedri TaxID=506608 RepID=A0A5E4MCJ7_9HEMI|nr:Insect odorant-binding protein A10/Ejaculatory bulb-specific protein 3 [Cinara cedri]